MVNTEEWKKAYNESNKVRNIFIVLAVIVIASSLAYFMIIDQGQPVKLDTKITAADFTYSAEGIASAEMLDAYWSIKNSSDAMSYATKALFGYNWTMLVMDPRDSINYKASALKHLLIQQAVTGFEYGYLSTLFNISDSEILSLTINKLDLNNAPKKNILLTASYLKTIEEFYKAKGLPTAKTNINRLDFLYAYFDAVDIKTDGAVTGNITKAIFDQHNAYYSMLMKRIEIIKAENNMITIQNIGREELNSTKELIVFVGGPLALSACQWSSEIIKPNEIHVCQLKEPCTGKNVRVTAPSSSKEAICS